ncbi:MAG TPA: class I SAM-dependent methyltransferase [Patescibacteria group bacterium]|nr:class I SAM-dependent methyltransferase [Patescibacteria group bacterium]
MPVRNIRVYPFLIAALVAVLARTAPAACLAQEEQQPLPPYDTLKVQFDDAYAAKDYEKALELAKRIDEVVAPQHWDNLYNIACIHALRGDKPKAYEYLYKAVDTGFWNARQMMEDEDLASLKGEDLHRQLARSAWANGYIWMLEREERKEFQKPDEVMKALEPRAGETVADIGAGSGYFTIPIAKAVGPDGTVLAIDISQHMLDYLERRIKAENLENIELRKVERDDPQLPAGGVDLILMVDTIHYTLEREARTAYARKLREGLAPGGRVVVIDYIPKSLEERPWGPPPEQHLPKETLNEDMSRGGLKVIREYDFLPEQYFVVYGAE